MAADLVQAEPVPPREAEPSAAAAGPRSPVEPRPGAALPSVTQKDLVGVARRGGLSLVGSVISGVFGFLVVIVLTHTVSASTVGTFFEAVAIFSIASNTSELGADTGLIRSLARYRALGRIADMRPTLRLALLPVYCLSALVAVVLFALAPQLGSVFFHGAHMDDGVAFLRLMILFLPLGACIPLLLAANRALGSIRPNVLVAFIGIPVARPILIVLGVAVFGATAAPLAWIIPVVPAFAAVAFVLQKRLRYHESQESSEPRRPLRVLAKDFWSFSSARGVAGMFEISIAWADVLIVGALLSPTAAAAYAAATRFVSTGTAALQAFRVATGAEITASLARREIVRAEDLHRSATAWIILCSWPLYLALAVFAPVVLHIFGKHFDQASTALSIIALAMLLDFATGNVQTVLLMGGQSRWQLINTGWSLAANVGLNFLLIPFFGLTGAAIAWTASIAINNIATVLQVRLMLYMRTFSAAGGIAAVASVGCYGVVGLLLRVALGPSLLGLLATIGLGTLLFAVVLRRYRVELGLSELWVALPVLGRSTRLGSASS